MVVSQFPLVQPHLYDAQIPPVVYLSGVLMFVGGLAIVRAHNYWVRDWTVLVTLSGWFFLALGLFRVFAAGQYQRSSANASATFFMVLEGIASDRTSHYLPGVPPRRRVAPLVPRMATQAHCATLRASQVAVAVAGHSSVDPS